MNVFDQVDFSKVAKSETLEVTNVASIKSKCIEFALETTKHGIYSPDEVLEEAKKIFNWMTDNEASKNKS